MGRLTGALHDERHSMAVELDELEIVDSCATLPSNAARTCSGCVFAVLKNGGVLYCAYGKAFKPGTPTVWEAERIIEATGTCGNWHKAFTPAPPSKPKRARKKPKAKQRVEIPAVVAQAQPLTLFDLGAA